MSTHIYNERAWTGFADYISDLFDRYVVIVYYVHKLIDKSMFVYIYGNGLFILVLGLIKYVYIWGNCIQYWPIKLYWSIV